MTNKIGKVRNRSAKFFKSVRSYKVIGGVILKWISENTFSKGEYGHFNLEIIFQSAFTKSRIGTIIIII